jgi:hypothetical protein
MQLAEPSPNLVLGICAAALIAIGISLVRFSRQRSSSQELGSPHFAWSAIALGFALFVVGCGAVPGLIYAFLAFGIGGYVAIASNITWRTSPTRGATSFAAEPEERPSNWFLASAKAVLALVLAGLAAFGIGEAFAVAMPLRAPDRIVVGALLVPILWGGGMAWTLADSKLRRAAIALAIIAAASFAIAFVPRVFH